MATTPRPGFRHFCASGDKSIAGHRHTMGAGKGPRRCRGCGSSLVIARGWWGCFPHSGGTGRYPADNALRLFTTRAAADRFADRRAADNIVVRWVDAPEERVGEETGPVLFSAPTTSSAPSGVLERLRAMLVREAQEQHAAYPQYAGHWESWRVVEVTERVRTKLGVAFEPGDVVLAAPTLTEGMATLYSRSNRVSTSVDPAIVGEVRVTD